MPRPKRLRTLTEAIENVTKAFQADDHLDRQHWNDAQLIDVHATTATDLDLGPAMLVALFEGDEDEWRDLAETIAAAKPDPAELRAATLLELRTRREAELLKPVTRVEVEFLDLTRPPARHWNLTHNKVHRLAGTPAFLMMSETAFAKGFTTQLETTSFWARAGFQVRLKLVFKAINFDTAFPSQPHRTVIWTERP